MMKRILSNLPKACKNIVENIEDKMDDNKYPLTIESIHSKL